MIFLRMALDLYSSAACSNADHVAEADGGTTQSTQDDVLLAFLHPFKAPCRVARKELQFQTCIRMVPKRVSSSIRSRENTSLVNSEEIAVYQSPGSLADAVLFATRMSYMASPTHSLSSIYRASGLMKMSVKPIQMDEKFGDYFCCAEVSPFGNV